MQLLCLFQQVESEEGGGRARENMNIPHLCSPTMRERVTKRLYIQGKWRFVIVYDLVSKIRLEKSRINFPKWHLMNSGMGFWFLISLVFNWCHKSKSGPYFKKEERMKTFRKHTKWPKNTLNHNSEKHIFLLNIVLVKQTDLSDMLVTSTYFIIQYVQARILAQSANSNLELFLTL